MYFKSHHLPQAVVTISHTNTSSKTFVHSQTGLCSPLHIINVNSKTLWPAVVQISTCGAITHTNMTFTIQCFHLLPVHTRAAPPISNTCAYSYTPCHTHNYQHLHTSGHLTHTHPLLTQLWPKASGLTWGHWITGSVVGYGCSESLTLEFVSVPADPQMPEHRL